MVEGENPLPESYPLVSSYAQWHNSPIHTQINYCHNFFERKFQYDKRKLEDNWEFVYFIELKVRETGVGNVTETQQGRFC